MGFIIIIIVYYIKRQYYSRRDDYHFAAAAVPEILLLISRDEGDGMGSNPCPGHLLHIYKESSRRGKTSPWDSRRVRMMLNERYFFVGVQLFVQVGLQAATKVT